MNFKSEKGFTGIDITVALIVLLLFMSIIATVFFGIIKSSKDIERESEATYIATNVIEAVKSLQYNDVPLTKNSESGETEAKEITEYKHQNQQIILTHAEGTQSSDSSSIAIPEGYTVYITVKNHIPVNSQTIDDLVKIVTIDVKYRLAGEVKNVELSTTLVRE